MSTEVTTRKFRASLALAALALAAVAVPLSAIAAPRRATQPHHHHAHRVRVAHRRFLGPPREAPAPNAGVPGNAIRMPGYTFVPGVGILGESCDLPTSACPNQYRDIQ